MSGKRAQEEETKAGQEEAKEAKDRGIRDMAVLILAAVLGIPVGAVTGALDALFGRVLLEVTACRMEYGTILIPLLALAGCGLCGLSVGIMWPGTFSLAMKHCPQGGTLMFALFALAGDVGCAAGPGVVSFVAERMPEYGLKAGLLAAILFPVVMLALLRAVGGKKVQRKV